MPTFVEPSEYPHNDRRRLFSTAGNQDSFGAAFYNNNFVFQHSPAITPNEFLIPMVSANTGTLSYYGQEDSSIFVIYARPFLSMIWTANTHVFTGDPRLVLMRNDIHKIDYRLAKGYQDNPTDAGWIAIADRIKNPVVVYTASTSSADTPISTAYTYTMLPEQLIKPDGRFTEEVFEDRAQYFFNNRFVFINTATTFASTFVFNQQEIPVNYPYSSTTYVTSTGPLSKITQGPWSGEVAQGFFFTCFQPPGKPILEFPLPATSTTNNFTFTPTFNFSNVEDGDEFILEVTYNMADTGFTDTTSSTGVTQYRERKVDNSKEQLVDKTNVTLVGNEITQTRTTRRINKPLKPGSEYLYRIGNSKSIINIFGIKNEIINYSNYYTAVTGSHEVINLIVDSRTVSSPSTAVTKNPPRYTTEAQVVK